VSDTTVLGCGEGTGDERPLDRADAASLVIRTKLTPPQTARDIVPRARLLERLTQDRVRPLVLVSAPAGYGKSVLASSWLESQDWAFTWLSLDARDADLRQFVTYLVAAIRNVFPGACESTLALVGATHPPLSAFVASLSNDLDSLDRPFILVLDDYHRIPAGSAVNELLSQLLARPPLPLHLVMLTRRDPPLPMLKLRASGQVTEIHMQDLRFTRQEVRSLLQTSLELTADEEVLAKLNQELEGWAVGLRLVSLALRRADDPEGLLKRLKGGVPQIQEYLLQEVVDGQRPGIQDWLMKSSILERFCASLCDAVCGAEDVEETPAIDGGEFIKALGEENLFVIPLDVTGEWFRYHHLFQALLQHQLSERLPAGEIARLHQRASAWYEERSLVDEAIRHALEAADPLRAALIVERHTHEALNQDLWYRLDQWLEMLPPGIVEESPRLLLGRAYVACYRQDLAGVGAVLEEVEPLLPCEVSDDDFRAEVAFFRGYVHFWGGNTEQSQRELERAVRLAPAKKELLMAEIEVHLGLCRYVNGEKDGAIRELEERIRASRSSSSVILPRMYGALALIHLFSGDLARAGLDARRMRKSATLDQSLLNVSWGEYLDGVASMHAMDLEAARDRFEDGTKYLHATDAQAAVDALAGLALTQQLMGRPTAAGAAVRRLFRFVDETGDPVHLSVVRSSEARLRLLQGDLDPAVRWARGTVDPLDPLAVAHWLEIPSVTRARVLIAEGSVDGANEADGLLREMRGLFEARRLIGQCIEVQVLQSLSLETQGRGDAARVCLEQALAMAQPDGWLRPFAEAGKPMVGLLEQVAARNGRTSFLARALDASRATEARLRGATAEEVGAPAARMVEPLTRRELDVLELLAARLQNKEIAARLFVSTETVKTHVKHLYQKLGVRNRREAAARANEIIGSTGLVSRATVAEDRA